MRWLIVQLAESPDKQVVASCPIGTMAMMWYSNLGILSDYEPVALLYLQVPPASPNKVYTNEIPRVLGCNLDSHKTLHMFALYPAGSMSVGQF